MAGEYSFEIVAITRQGDSVIHQASSKHVDLSYEQLLEVQAVGARLGEQFTDLGRLWVKDDPEKGKGKGKGKSV